MRTPICSPSTSHPFSRCTRPITIRATRSQTQSPGHLQSEGKSAVFRCVGRLDKGTSGVVVCALNRYAAARLSGNISKKYIAVVRGRFEGSGTINKHLPPRPDENSARVRRYARERERSNALGEPVFKRRIQPAESHSRDRQNASDKGAFSASMDAPLAGDTMYGASENEIGHHLLHCAECDFIHPASGEEIRLSAPPPQDFLDFCRSFISADVLAKIFNYA